MRAGPFTKLGRKLVVTILSLFFYSIPYTYFRCSHEVASYSPRIISPDFICQLTVEYEHRWYRSYFVWTAALLLCPLLSSAFAIWLAEFQNVLSVAHPAFQNVCFGAKHVYALTLFAELSQEKRKQSVQRRASTASFAHRKGSARNSVCAALFGEGNRSRLNSLFGNEPEGERSRVNSLQSYQGFMSPSKDHERESSIKIQPAPKPKPSLKKSNTDSFMDNTIIDANRKPTLSGRKRTSSLLDPNRKPSLRMRRMSSDDALYQKFASNSSLDSEHAALARNMAISFPRRSELADISELAVEPSPDDDDSSEEGKRSQDSDGTESSHDSDDFRSARGKMSNLMQLANTSTSNAKWRSQVEQIYNTVGQDFNISRVLVIFGTVTKALHATKTLP